MSVTLSAVLEENIKLQNSRTGARLFFHRFFDDPLIEKTGISEFRRFQNSVSRFFAQFHEFSAEFHHFLLSLALKSSKIEQISKIANRKTWHS